MDPILTIADRKFAIKVMRKFNIPKLRIKWSDSKAKWPDIWVKLSAVPIITVTREWARQNKDERRKRLVHEMLHIKGYNHPEGGETRIGNYIYSTYPKRDTYSRHVYEKIK